MQTNLEQEFKDVFTLYRSGKAPKTAFTSLEIEALQEIFEKNAPNVACELFYQGITDKEEEEGDLGDDPFVQAIVEAYQQYETRIHTTPVSSNNTHTQEPQPPEEENPVVNPQEQNDGKKEELRAIELSSLLPPKTVEVNDAYIRNKNIAINKLFCDLFMESKDLPKELSAELEKIFQGRKASLEVKKRPMTFSLNLEKKSEIPSLEQWSFEPEKYQEIIPCLELLFGVIYYYNCINNNDKFNPNTPEAKFVFQLLTAFLLCNEPTISDKEHEKFIKRFLGAFLYLESSFSSDRTRYPDGRYIFFETDENLIRDLFSLRLKTLTNPERVQCKETFGNMAIGVGYEGGCFQSHVIPEKTTYLLTSQQFFTNDGCDEDELLAYQTFIEKIAATAVMYRTTPFEQNASLIAALFDIGIERVISGANYPTGLKLLIEETVGNGRLSAIPPLVKKFLAFLLKMHQTSPLLLPKKDFNDAVERLLLERAKLLPSAADMMPEVLLYQKYTKIYQKFAEYNSDKVDQVAFLQKLQESIQPKYAKVSLKTENDYQKVLYRLFEAIHEANYPFIKKRVYDLCTLPNSGELNDEVIKLIPDLGSWANEQFFQPFPELPVYLRGTIESQATLITELRKTSEAKDSCFLQVLTGLMVDDPYYYWTRPEWRKIKGIVEPMVKEGFVKAALISVINYALVDCENPNLPGNWRFFREYCIWLFIALHNPSDTSDQTLIANLKSKGYLKDRIFFELPQSHTDDGLIWVLKKIGHIAEDYPQVSWNQNEIEKMLHAVVKNHKAPSLTLLEFLPRFVKNETLFNLLLKIFYQYYTKAPTPDDLKTDLKTLEPNEAHKKLVQYVADQNFQSLKARQPKTDDSALNDTWRQQFETFMLWVYEALNHQNAEISEVYLEYYFSFCRAGWLGYFIDFLLKKLPANFEQRKLNYFRKMTESCADVFQYEDITNRVSNYHPEKVVAIILDTIPLAFNKFSGNADCFRLLNILEDLNQRAIYQDTHTQEQAKKIYAEIAEHYLKIIQAEFDKPIPKILIENKSVEGIESLLVGMDAKKQEIREKIQADKAKLLQPTKAECNLLWDWHIKLGEYSEKIKAFEDKINALPTEITNRMKSLVATIAIFEGSVPGNIKNLFKWRDRLEGFSKICTDNEVKTAMYTLNLSLESGVKVMRGYMDPDFPRNEKTLEQEIENTLKGKSLGDQNLLLDQFKKDLDALKIKNEVFLKRYTSQLKEIENFFIDKGQAIVNAQAEKLTALNLQKEQLAKTIEEKQKETPEIIEHKDLKKDYAQKINGILQAIHKSESTLQKLQEDLAFSFFYFKDQQFKKQIKNSISLVQKKIDHYKKEWEEDKNALGFKFAKWIIENDYDWFGIQSWARLRVDRAERELAERIGALEDLVKRANSWLPSPPTPLPQAGEGSISFLTPSQVGERNVTTKAPSEAAEGSVTTKTPFSPMGRRVGDEGAMVDYGAARLIHPTLLNDVIEQAERYQSLQSAYDAALNKHTKNMPKYEGQLHKLEAKLKKTNEDLSKKQAELAAILQISHKELVNANQQHATCLSNYENLLTALYDLQHYPLLALLYDKTSTGDKHYDEKQKYERFKNDLSRDHAAYLVNTAFENPAKTISASLTYHLVKKGTTEMLALFLSIMNHADKKTLLNHCAIKIGAPSEKSKCMAPLHRAIDLNDFAKVKLLVEAGCDLNLAAVVDNWDVPTDFATAKIFHGFSGVQMPPLVFAYHLDREEMVNYLLEKGADINAKDNMHKKTILHMAAQRGDSEMVTRLLKYPNIETNEADAIGCTALFSVIRPDYSHPPHAILPTLVMNVSRYQTACALFSHFSIKKQLEKTSNCLDKINCNSLKNALNENHFVHFCIQQSDNLPFLSWLINRKFYDPSFRNNAGDTPLQAAARVGCLKIFEAVWNKEPNVNQVDADGTSALSIALSQFSEKHQIALFILYNTRFDLEKLKVNNGHQRLLAECVHHNNFTCLKQLVAKGIELNLPDANGNTIFHLAVKANNLLLVQELVKIQTEKQNSAKTVLHKVRSLLPGTSEQPMVLPFNQLNQNKDLPAYLATSFEMVSYLVVNQFLDLQDQTSRVRLMKNFLLNRNIPEREGKLLVDFIAQQTGISKQELRAELGRQPKLVLPSPLQSNSSAASVNLSSSTLVVTPAPMNG